MGLMGVSSPDDIDDKLSDTDATGLPIDDLVAIEEAAPGIRTWLEDVHKELVGRLKARDPETREYYMLVKGKKSKSFTLEEAALVKKLQNTLKLKKGQIYQTKLNTPAALLKVEGLSAKQIEGIKKLIQEESKSMSMVPRDANKTDAMPVATSMEDMVEQPAADATSFLM